MADSLFLKVIVVGDSGVGKTSLLNQYCYGKFDTATKPTVGCDFSLKAFNDYNGKSIRLQLWDVAGQERFHSMSRLYVRGAFGCIIVSDIMNEDSLKSTLKWKAIVEENAEPLDGRPIPILLLQNKKDLIDTAGTIPDTATQKFLDGFAGENKFLKGFQVSAKTGENIDAAIKTILDEILSRNLAVKDSFFDNGGNTAGAGGAGNSNTVKLDSKPDSGKKAGGVPKPDCAC